MPFPTSVLKLSNTKMYFTIAKIAFMIIVCLWVWMKHSEIESLQLKLDNANQSIRVLETMELLWRKKARQRELDAIKKQELIDSIKQEKSTLESEYQATVAELDHLLNEVIPGIKTSDDKEAVRETVKQIEKRVDLSYKCIEFAMRGEKCEK